MHGLDLFSGYGGISYALKEYVTPIAYCEIEPYAQGILLSRMEKGEIFSSPIWDDVRTFPARGFKGLVDIIYGGFPCQDISVAGHGVGIKGKRSGLFAEIIRLAKEIEPTFLFLENVPAIRTRGLDTIIEEFTAIGYDIRWTMLSAAYVGAPHKRQRWFLLASNTKRIELWNQPRRRFRAKRKSETFPRNYGSKKSLANPDVTRSQVRQSEPLNDEPKLSPPFGSEWWAFEPNVGRVVNGGAFRVDRIKSLGNGVVPLQAKTAFEILMGLK